jgi:chemotaxis protein MotB
VKTRLIATFALLTVIGCGHPESEWKAQLAKYGSLNTQYVNEKKAHAETQAALDNARAKVVDLEQQLQKLGFELNNTSVQLQQTGTEKEQLASNVKQLRQALDEYRVRAEQLEKIKKRFEMLRDKLKLLTEQGLKVEVRNNRMVIRLPGDVLFPSGSDKLKDQGIQVLKTVADVIRNDAQLSKRYFQIAGHTDNKPLQGGPFRDNWGLSLMRAREVLLWFIAPVDGKEGGGGLSVSRLHAAGYGETDPVQSNTDDKSRSANRRVELILLPDVEEMLDLRQML